MIENKVYDALDTQAQSINLQGAGVQLAEGQTVVRVSGGTCLRHSAGSVSGPSWRGAEAGLLDDFLTYTEDHFPDLGPFRRLALCRGIPVRIDRRLRQVLGEATGSEAETKPHGSCVATPAGTVAGRDAYLRRTDQAVDGQIGIELALYPADTLTQASAVVLQERKEGHVGQPHTLVPIRGRGARDIEEIRRGLLDARVVEHTVPLDARVYGWF